MSAGAPGSPRWVRWEGAELAIDAADSLGLASGNPFEPAVAQALRRHVRPGDTVVDVGANVGCFTALLAQAVGPAGRVHAIEPEPGNLALLRQSVSRNGWDQVTLHGVAAADRDGTLALHTSTFNNGMHRLYESVCCDGQVVQVPVRRLDDLLAGSRVDLLKLDVEGYEWAVVQGAEHLLRANPALVVVTEYCPSAMLEAGGSPTAFLDRLARLGLVPHELDGTPLHGPSLREEATRYDQLGRDRFVDACSGLDNEAILQRVQALAAGLGCRRPVIDNLLFRRA